VSGDPITWLDGGPTTPFTNLDLLEEFARRFLDPEDLGHSVNAYTRDQARVALGRKPVESSFPPPRKTSMTTPDQAIESAIVAAGANVSPRIKPADIARSIVSEHYFTAADGVVGVLATLDAEDKRPGDLVTVAIAADVPDPLELLTFCVLVLRNGFTVTGESACASPENYNKAIGERIARENAVAKIWPLMGYELRTRIAEGRTTIADRTGC
jgi:hypothetical protein